MKAQIEIFVLFVCLKIIIRIYVFLWLYTSIINPMKRHDV